MLALLLAACGGGTTPECSVDADCGAGRHCDAGTCAEDAPPMNGPPTASADAYDVAEDETLEIAAAGGVLGNDADPDGDPLTVELAEGPASGVLALHADGSFTYLPAPDLHGTVSFTYRARDGAAASAPATVTIDVAAAPDAPVALADAYVATAGVPLVVAPPLGVLANDRDADGDLLTAVVVAAPAHGTLELEVDGGFAYTADAGFSGTDRFTYRASDGVLASAGTEVSVAVAGAPAAPVASPDAYAVSEDGVLDVAAAGVLANDDDANGDPLSAALLVGAAHGTVTLAVDGSFRYAPAPDFHGPDAFTYRASDGALFSGETAVSLSVSPVPDAPVAAADAYQVETSVTLRVAAAGVLANDSDADGDPLVAALAAAPEHGSVDLSSDGSFVYSSAPGYVGQDLFTYRALDGALVSDDTAVTITVVAATAHPPVAAADAFTTLQARPLEIAVPGVLANDSDPDGDALTAIVVGGPSHGYVKSWLAAGAFRYVPDPTFVGTDSFTYQASDPGGLRSAETTVTVTVVDRNVAPVALTDAFTTAPDAAVTGNLRGTDLDGDALSFDLVAPPSHGTATLDAATGAVTYSPEAGFEGGDALSFRVSDGVLWSEPARVSFGVASSRPRWTADGAPAPRTRHTAVWTGSELIAWGGNDEAASLDSGARLDPGANTWRRTTRAGAPAPRWRHTAVWTGTEMIVWGGERGNFPVLEAGGRYDPATDSWTPVTTTGAPSARTQHTAVWTGQHMIVCGGRYGVQVESASHRYDPATNAWAPISATGSGCGRYGHTAVWTGAEMIVWGGSTSGGARYDPATNTWRPMSTVGAPAARFDFVAVWTGSELVVWGGSSTSTGAPYGDGARYDPATDTWTAIATSGAPSARWGAAAVWTGSRVLVWGGATSTVATASDGAAFDPATGTWTPLTSAGAPVARQFHSATWTGEEMIVFGGMVGLDGSRRLGSGGRYDPVADTWTATAETGAPSVRTEHAAVWTGAELLVWGGRSATQTNTGGRYDPVARTWAPLPTIGAPSARSYARALWTGDRMIVWASNSASTARSGGVFDPVAGTWTAISTVGAPNAISPAAVWTGREMIVWGGLDAAAPTPRPPVGTGARYDPATDTWRAMATAGAPSPRYGHSAVWTGSEMIVWGGNGDAACPTGMCGTGAAYDPVADRWRPISSAPSWPDGRSQHLAVWTGDRMIVWGGTANSGPLQTGHVYDPAADAWAALPVAGAPRARVPVHGVWTGRELLVWGDADVYGAGDTGGLFDPATGTWRASSLDGAPPPMTGHAVAWTGQLLVFGGPGNEVWRYDP